MPEHSRTVLYLVLVIAGCSSGDGDALRQQLETFDSATTSVVDNMVALGDDLLALQEAIAEQDDAAIEAIADRQPALLDALERDLERLEAAEVGLQAQLTGSANGSLRQALSAAGGVGFFATLRGLAQYVSELRNLSKRMSQHRKSRDEALVDLGNNVDGAQQRYDDADAKVKSTGTQAMEVMVKKVSTELVTAPFRTKTIGQVLFKEAAGKAYGKGLDVLSGSKACESAPDGDACVVSVGRTDGAGRVSLPAGKQSLVVSGGGRARVRLDDVDVISGGEVSITQPRPPIDSATRGEVTRGSGPIVGPDAGTNPPPGDYYVMCRRSNGPSLEAGSTWACLAYGGDPDQLTSTIAGSWCKQQGYDEFGGWNGADGAECGQLCEDKASIASAHRCGG